MLVTSGGTTNFGFSCTPKEQPRRWQAVSERPRAGCRTRREPTPPVPPRGGLVVVVAVEGQPSLCPAPRTDRAQAPPKSHIKIQNGVARAGYRRKR